MSSKRPEAREVGTAADCPSVDTPVQAHLAGLERRLIDLSYEPILAWRIEGGIVLWNTGCERLYGYARSEAIGRTSHALLHTVHPTPLPEILDTLRARGQWTGNLRHRTRDGHDIVVESRQQLVTIDGEALVLETNRDVTERRRAVAARAMLASMVESSSDAIIATALDGTITFWNPAAEQIFGFTSAEAVGQSIRLITPSDRRTDNDEALRRLQSGELLEPIETVRRRKDGTLVAVSVHVSPIRDGFGTLIGASKVVRDITPRKRAAERAAFLTEATKLLVASLDYETTVAAVAHLAVPAIADWAAVDLIAADRRIERVATAHADPSRIDFARRIEMQHEDPAASYSVTAVIRTGKPFIVRRISDEMIVASARGDAERVKQLRSLGLISYLCVPLVAHGRTLGALTLATAESLREYTDEDLAFAQEVAYHVALAIDNAQAYTEAQVANRLKDEFLATLSHELRTPLNAILGYSRLIRSGMTPVERGPHAIEAVERNATALTRIVEDVLDVSRIISGKIRLEIQSVDLPDVVKRAVETVTPAADAKQLRLHTFIDPNAGPICGDPDRLQQILWNLVSNAVKFTAKGGTVQVRVERVHSHVEIAVSDTGVGITPEFLPHIFERFRQADATTTRTRGGLGLGLAIARHLVELHGGTIDASSEGEGRGTTFIVRLPVTIVHAAQPLTDRRAQAERSAATSLVARLDGVRVLAVDDDVDSLKVVQATLESAGAEVVTAHSTLEALDRLNTVHPDALIADIGMPEIDGRELVRRIRQSSDPQIRDVPAAALSAYARSEDRVASLQSGFQMHLTKPIEPAELIAATAALVKAEGRSDSAD